MGRTIKISTGDGEGFLSETSPIGPRSRQPRPNSLGDPCSLELGDRGQDVHLQFAGWSGRVDALLQADEGHAEGLQLVQQRDQMAEIPAQPIQSPADQDVKPSPAGVRHQSIQGRPPILSAAHATVCPAKAGVFSGSESHRGKSQRPRSLDSSQEGNRLV